MGNDPAAWMIPAAALLAVILFFTFGARSERRRRAHFAALAAHRGTPVATIGEGSNRFTVTIDERTLEVRDERRGGGLGSSTSGSQYFTIATKLRGHAWELHSVIIRRKFRSASRTTFAERFRVDDLGLPMPQHWLTDDVRAAIESELVPADSAANIEIDAGELVLRSMASPVTITPATLDALLANHAQLASAVERARR